VTPAELLAFAAEWEREQALFTDSDEDHHEHVHGPDCDHEHNHMTMG
jgi:trigger factor